MQAVDMTIPTVGFDKTLDRAPPKARCSRRIPPMLGKSVEVTRRRSLGITGWVLGLSDQKIFLTATHRLGSSLSELAAESLVSLQLFAHLFMYALYDWMYAIWGP